jgi:hypothetical protein
MVDTYQAMTVDERKCGGTLIQPECVDEETKEWVFEGDDEFTDAINARYEITGAETDRVPAKDIVDYIINECRLNMSAQKIGRNLTNLIRAKNKDLSGESVNPIVKNGEVGKQRVGIRLLGAAGDPVPANGGAGKK